MLERNRSFKSYKRNTSSNNEQIYIENRRKVKKLIRSAKRNEEIRIASITKSNPKEFFIYVNSRNPVKNEIGALKNSDGILVYEDLEKAHLLNKYFCSVYTQETLQNFPAPTIINNDIVLDTIVLYKRKSNKLD